MIVLILFGWLNIVTVCLNCFEFDFLTDFCSDVVVRIIVRTSILIFTGSFYGFERESLNVLKSLIVMFKT